jgi:hypothetical protein
MAIEFVLAATDAKCAKVTSNASRVTVPVLPDHIELIGYYCNHCEGVHSSTGHCTQQPKHACEVKSTKKGVETEGRRGFVHLRAWCTIAFAVGDFLSSQGALTTGAVQQLLQGGVEPASTVIQDLVDYVHKALAAARPEQAAFWLFDNFSLRTALTYILLPEETGNKYYAAFKGIHLPAGIAGCCTVQHPVDAAYALQKLLAARAFPILLSASWDLVWAASITGSLIPLFAVNVCVC